MFDNQMLHIIVEETKSWRHFLHQHPELLFDLPNTASLNENKLYEFGREQVVSGIARSGVIAVIKGNREMVIL